MMMKSPAPLDLSKHTIKHLQKAYKQERERRLADRIQCIILFAEGMALQAVRKILFVGIKTLKKWIETFRTQGLEGLLKWGYTGQAGQLNDAQWAEVEGELDKNFYRRAHEVAIFVKREFGVEYSDRGMQALLRRKGYRHIKTRLVPGKVDEAKQQEQREFLQEYETLKAELGPHDRVYHVDGVHPTHNVKITYVWTKKGTRRRVKSNTGRKRYNILGAYCAADREYVDVRGTGNVNATTLQTLIDTIRARHPEAERIILILDNARYNHAKLVKEHIEDTIVELKHLPSYSPNLNLIERLWRFLKDKVMTAYHESFERFVKAIDTVLDNLELYTDELIDLMTEKFEILACA
jgi:transposase